MSNEYNIYTLCQNMIDDLESNKEEIITKSEDEADDMIHKIADGNVPVLYAALLGYASEYAEFATDEPDFPAFDGKATPINIIAANIYEYLLEIGRQWFSEERSGCV